MLVFPKVNMSVIEVELWSRLRVDAGRSHHLLTYFLFPGRVDAITPLFVTNLLFYCPSCTQSIAAVAYIAHPA